MLDVFLIIAPLFIIIFASAVFEYVFGLGKNWSSVLNDYALHLGLPALIFSALSKTSISFMEQADLIYANSLFIIGGFLLAYFIAKFFHFSEKNLKTLFICLAFGNIAYLGIPTILQVLGSSVLAKVGIIVALYLFWMFTIGVGFLDFTQEKKRTLKDAFNKVFLHLIKNPLLLAVISGFFIAGFEIKVNETFMKAVDMIAASVTPVVLVVIGLFVGRSKLGKISDWVPVFLFSLTTLLILPGLFYLALEAFGYNPQIFSASIIEAAMPLAITPFALADEYKLNKGFIARSIVLSTVFSVISIPFWISML